MFAREVGTIFSSKLSYNTYRVNDDSSEISFGIDPDNPIPFAFIAVIKPTLLHFDILFQFGEVPLQIGVVSLLPLQDHSAKSLRLLILVAEINAQIPLLCSSIFQFVYTKRNQHRKYTSQLQMQRFKLKDSRYDYLPTYYSSRQVKSYYFRFAATSASNSITRFCKSNNNIFC